MLGIVELKNVKEAPLIIKKSPDLTHLYAEGIINEVEKDLVRQEAQFESSGGQITETSAMLLHERPRPQKAFFESQEGGLVSKCGKFLYFMGIIDTLTGYGTSKKLENTFKSIVYDSKTISCIPPQQYSERFYNFMCDEVYNP